MHSRHRYQSTKVWGDAKRGSTRRCFIESKFLINTILGKISNKAGRSLPGQRYATVVTALYLCMTTSRSMDRRSCRCSNNNNTHPHLSSFAKATPVPIYDWASDDKAMSRDRALRRVRSLLKSRTRGSQPTWDDKTKDNSCMRFVAGNRTCGTMPSVARAVWIVQRFRIEIIVTVLGEKARVDVAAAVVCKSIALLQPKTLTASPRYRTDSLPSPSRDPT